MRTKQSDYCRNSLDTHKPDEMALVTLEHALRSSHGLKRWVHSTDSMLGYRHWRDRDGEAPLGVARPAVTAETAGSVALRVDAKMPVVPQIGSRLRRVQGGNARYKLRKPLYGTEGTLAVVTCTALKTSPAPVQRVHASCGGVDGVDIVAAIALTARFRTVAGEFLAALEIFSDLGRGSAPATVQTLSVPPWQRALVCMLIGAALGSQVVPLYRILSDLMESGMLRGDVLDGAIAKSEIQGKAIWRLREEQPNGQKRSGAQLKHDVSVSSSALPEFLERTTVEWKRIPSSVWINAFGYLGGRSLHFNLSPLQGQPGRDCKGHELPKALGRRAPRTARGFAAVHGLGRVKITVTERLRDSVERRSLAQIKFGFDPGGIVSSVVIGKSRSLDPSRAISGDFWDVRTKRIM